MPYEWTCDAAPERSGAVGVPGGAPLAVLRLWPHRSLPPEGFAGFFLATAGLAAVPLLAVLGSAVLWFVLAPLVLAVAGAWWALRHSYRTAQVAEEMRLWPDRMTLVRLDRRGERRWEANPHWVRPALHPSGGPVPQYLTLTGAGRTVEIGAFLSEDERLALLPEIEGALARLR